MCRLVQRCKLPILAIIEPNLLESAIGSKNIFPTLVSMSASSVEANNSLKTTLEIMLRLLMTWITLRPLMARIFDSLLKQRADDQVNYAAFMKQLMEMDEKSCP